MHPSLRPARFVPAALAHSTSARPEPEGPLVFYSSATPAFGWFVYQQTPFASTDTQPEQPAAVVTNTSG